MGKKNLIKEEKEYIAVKKKLSPCYGEESFQNS